MKNIRKKAYYAIIFTLCFALSGCIDIFQHITKDSNGIDRNTIKVTVSKVVFAMANGLSGAGDIDYEKLFDESNNIDVKEYNQFNASVKTVNDSMDVGYLVDMSIDYQDKNMVTAITQNDISFIPKYSDKNITIHIASLGGNAGSVSDNDMAAAFLATGKYRLTVNKACIADIDRAAIKTRDGEKEISVLDLYDGYLIEIPIPIIFMSDIDLVLYSKNN
ncbi:MAG: hypothetical protein LBG73_07430 [Spirochaetaceae bacterium]|jgi:hypothetical protein|nr:hypothetical protein [Spirochaetaceae bacterium]